jgi:hypothetical protein
MLPYLPRSSLLHAFPPPPMQLHALCDSLLTPLMTLLASFSSCHPPASLLLAAVMLAAKHTGDGNSSWSYDIYTRATGVPVGELKVRRLPVSLFSPLQSLLLVLPRPPFWFFAATFEFLSPAIAPFFNLFFLVRPLILPFSCLLVSTHSDSRNGDASDVAVRPCRPAPSIVCLRNESLAVQKAPCFPTRESLSLYIVHT